MLLPDDDESDAAAAVGNMIIRRIRTHLIARGHVVDSQQQHPQHPQQQSSIFLPCHVIDLHKEGDIHAHVDSVRFSGDCVAGLSLLSNSIMRLQRPAVSTTGGGQDGEEEESDKGDNDSSSTDMDDRQQHQHQHDYIDMYLPRRSLYVMTGMSRYEYTHELLPCGSVVGGCPRGNSDDDNSDSDNENNTIVVERARRLSIIFRDAKR